MAPAKWYGYDDIEEALVFVTDAKWGSLYAALNEWDGERTDRIDNGDSPGPSKSTVARWHRDLADASATKPWQARVVSQVIREQSDHPIASQLPQGEGSHPRVVALVRALTALGSLLILLSNDLRNLCALAAGLWCIEGQYKARCFAGPSLHGRIIPGPSPKVTSTPILPIAYPPRSRKSGPDP